MKNFFVLSLVVMALTFTSCNGSGNNSATPDADSKQTESATTDTASSSADTSVANQAQQPPVAPLPLGDKAKAPQVGSLEKPEKQVRPETETDKMIKRYNELLVTMIMASNEGKEDAQASQQFLKLQDQIDRLQQDGKLSDTQIELYKVAKDTYTKLKNKNK